MTAIPEGRKWLAAFAAGIGAASIVFYVMIVALIPVVWAGVAVWVVYELVTKLVLAH